MKLLSEKLLKQIPLGRGEAFAHDLLKLPAANHAPHQVPPGLCDRFIFPASALPALRDSPEDLIEQVCRIGRLPTPGESSWIEIAGNGAWLIRNRHAFGFCEPVKGHPVRFIGALDLDCIPFEMPQFQWAPAVRAAARDVGGDYLDLWAQWFTNIVPALMALASPHTATTRRIEPGRDGARAQRAFIRRRAQRGQPVFSFNQVEMIIPRAAMHNGVLKTAESFAGVRMHQVIGHWRLIDGVIEPYWVWVEGHQRGNIERGAIVKQRNVYLAPHAPRRGFLMPREAGAPGERRPAEGRPT